MQTETTIYSLWPVCDFIQTLPTLLENTELGYTIKMCVGLHQNHDIIAQTHSDLKLNMLSSSLFCTQIVARVSLRIDT